MRVLILSPFIPPSIHHSMPQDASFQAAHPVSFPTFSPFHCFPQLPVADCAHVYFTMSPAHQNLHQNLYHSRIAVKCTSRIWGGDIRQFKGAYQMCEDAFWRKHTRCVPGVEFPRPQKLKNPMDLSLGSLHIAGPAMPGDGPLHLCANGGHV